MQDQDMTSKAEYIANIVAGKGLAGYSALTVQRSNGFLLHQFILIENMTKVADCSVATCITRSMRSMKKAIRRGSLNYGVCCKMFGVLNGKLETNYAN